MTVEAVVVHVRLVNAAVIVLQSPEAGDNEMPVLFVAVPATAEA